MPTLNQTCYVQLPKRQRPKSNSYIIHEDRIRVVIATGFKRKSKNAKTGNMIQIWIIRKDISPVDAVYTGKDKAICGNCPLRGNKGQERECYVTVAHSPLATWKKFKRGQHPKLTDFSLFTGLDVRFGAYGDPVWIPLPILQQIASYANSWTGYTHQWRSPLYSAYKAFLMASVEDLSGMLYAQSLGWRTFRVTADLVNLAPSEIVCVNTTKGITCAECGLCCGTTLQAKSIAIQVHGTGATYFNRN